LDRFKAGGELADLLDPLHGASREKADANTAAVGKPGDHAPPLTVKALDEVIERLRLTDLLHSQHVGRKFADDPSELSQLEVIRVLATRPALPSRRAPPTEPPPQPTTAGPAHPTRPARSTADTAQRSRAHQHDQPVLHAILP
jgi:hypothetical protein